MPSWKKYILGVSWPHPYALRNVSKRVCLQESGTWWQRSAGVCNDLPCGKGTERAYSYGVLGSSPANISKSYRQRAFAVQQVIRHHEGERSWNAEIRYEADEQRGDDADGDGPLGVLHFFTWCVKTESKDKLYFSSTPQRMTTYSMEWQVVRRQECRKWQGIFCF